MVTVVRPLSAASTTWFTYTIYSIILCYSIVLFKSYSFNRIFKTVFTEPFFFLTNNNSLYLLLSMLFLANHDIMRYIQGALYPFAIYSLFHSLNYLNNNILGSSALGAKSKISAFTKNYYEKSLFIAANLELTVLLQLIFACIRNVITVFRTGPAVAIRTFTLTALYVAFVKLRFDDSIHMKTIIQSYDLRINQFLYTNQKIPKPIVAAWTSIRAAISTYVSPIKIIGASRR